MTVKPHNVCLWLTAVRDTFIIGLSVLMNEPFCHVFLWGFFLFRCPCQGHLSEPLFIINEGSLLFFSLYLDKIISVAFIKTTNKH